MSKIKHFELTAVIKRGWLLYRTTVRFCFWLAFAYGLVNQLLNVYAQRFVVLNGHEIMIRSPIWLAVMLIIAIAVLTLVSAMIMVKQNTMLFQMKHMHLGSEVMRRLPALVAAGIIFYVLVIIGYLLYIVPGIIVAMLFYFYLPAMLFENKKVLPAFGYSFRLVKHNIFGVLGLVIFNFLILSVPVLAAHAIFRGAAGDGFGIEEVVIVIIQAFLMPLIIALTLTAFYHLRELSHANA